MEIINIYGLIIMAVIMIPNIIFGFRHKEVFENKYHYKIAEPLEQVGRFGAFGFMIVNIPYLCRGFWFENALFVYIAVNSALCILYCLVWIICGNQSGLYRAAALSVLPSVIFIFSGIMLLNIPLIIFSVLFSFCHIYISLKNVL